jgi:uncharacterized repeat protein (TIGR01451 family)
MNSDNLIENMNLTPFINQNRATGSFVPNNGEMPITIASNSNIVQTDILRIKLIISANKTNAVIGNDVEYKITFINNSTLDVMNVKITNNTSPFLAISNINLNGATVTKQDLNNGISIPSVSKNGGMAIITYNATILSNTENSILNSANAELQYFNNNNIETHFQTSKQVAIPIIRPYIITTKTASKSVVISNGETLIYTVNVENKGNVGLQDVVVTDPIPNNMQYLPNSTSINGGGLINADPQNGINIGTINAGGSATVSFGVSVIL